MTERFRIGGSSAAGLRVRAGTENLGVPPDAEAMPTEVPTPEPGRPSFRATLVRVLIVQVITLALLAALQLGYNG